MPGIRLGGLARTLPERSNVQGDLLYLVTQGIMRTVRLMSYGADEVRAYKERGRPIMFVCWHGHDFLNLGGYHQVFGRDARSVIMAPDDLNGQVMHRFGDRMHIDVVTLPGADSGSMQSARAVARLIGQVKGGHDGLLAVDGPQGPLHVVKPGAAMMAQRAGAIIAPGAAAAWPSLSLTNRWDHHLVPLPFSRAVMYFGPVIDPAPPDAPKPTIEELQARITDALVAGTARAQELVRARR